MPGGSALFRGGLYVYSLPASKAIAWTVVCGAAVARMRFQHSEGVPIPSTTATQEGQRLRLLSTALKSGTVALVTVWLEPAENAVGRCQTQRSPADAVMSPVAAV